MQKTEGETGSGGNNISNDERSDLRKQIEEELRETEERYRSLLENANDIIYSHDLQGRYLAINRAGERITGYTREEILGGLNMAEVVVPEHLEKAKEMIRQKLQNPSPTVYEIDIFAKDGRRLTLEVSTRISFKNNQPVAIEGVAREVTERKKAERERAFFVAELEKQRKHLQELVANVPGVVWETWINPDSREQKLDFVSDYMETMLGYSVEEWFRTPNFWFKVIHENDRERVRLESEEKIKNQQGGTTQFRARRKDGKVVWLETQTAVICDDSGEVVGLRGVTMDITARRQKEDAERFLTEASAQLSSSLDYETTLANVAQLAVPHFADWCAVDIAEENGAINRLAVAHVDAEKVSWAKELHEKYPPNTDAPHGLYNVLRSGVSEFYPEITDEMLTQGAIDEKHLEALRKVSFCSVMLVPLKARHKTLGVLTFVNSDCAHPHTLEDLRLAENLANRAALAVDNARLFRAEQTVRRAAERTSNLLWRLQAASASLSQALTPKQVTTSVIEQAVNSLGAHAGSVVLLNDKSELEIIGAVGFSPGVLEKWGRFPVSQKVPLADAVRENKPVIIDSFDKFFERYAFLGPLASVTGSQALVAFPLIVEGRTIGGLGLSFPTPQNFTEDDEAFMQALAQQCAQAIERARLYETEKQLRKQAEAANRVKDEFLATVSHELRTPLNSIVGWSSLLKTKKLDDETTARAIETIDRNAKAQAQIIEDLLDVSRIITGKLKLDTKLVDLDWVINASLEGFRPAAESKRINLSFRSDETEVKAPGDAARLQQIIWNLLSNAVKFTPIGGSVEVELKRENSSAQISIKDSGQGIEPEFLPYVFERFRQADGSTTRLHGGLGLGLSIVRQLVELHGGNISAESEGIGKGATFTVYLPLRFEPSVEPDSDQNAESSDNFVQGIESPVSLKGTRILLVDDEADTQILLTTLIGQYGATVMTAGSAAEALEIFRHFKPDILVSDIGMPKEDGYSLINKIRMLDSEENQTPAIALTAYTREDDRRHALAAGFQEHLKKPVNTEELITAIKRFAEKNQKKKI